MKCITPREIYVAGVGNQDGEYMKVPCGKCLVCLQNKRNDWTLRLMEEYQHSSSAMFLTLTYNEKYLPKVGVVKRHFQLFMKRLRKSSTKKLRYYAVGEYGSKSGRAHYHAIIFNYDGNQQKLEKIWTHPKTLQPLGMVHVGKVNQASVAYVTKYVIQRPTMGRDSVNPPFSIMSRAYGIGGKYLSDEMVSWHRDGSNNYYSKYNQKQRLPRFYRDKIWPLLGRPPKKYPGEGVFCSKWTLARARVIQNSRLEAEKAELENIRLIVKAGHKDPHAIIAEMRHAVISRIHQKVAFTQTF